MATNKKKNRNSKNKQRSAEQQVAIARARAAKGSARGKEGKGIFAYFMGVRKELAKVVWPKKDELISDTVVVFAVCGIFALGFWLVDTGFLAALKHLLGITLS